LKLLKTLRVWYLQDQQDKDRDEKDIRLKEEQKVISKTIEGSSREIVEDL
jgi:hypothetical protein